MSDDSTAVLQMKLERALTGDAEARQRLLELTRNRLMDHARRFLHGSFARLEPRPDLWELDLAQPNWGGSTNRAFPRLRRKHFVSELPGSSYAGHLGAGKLSRRSLGRD